MVVNSINNKNNKCVVSLVAFYQMKFEFCQYHGLKVDRTVFLDDFNLLRVIKILFLFN